MEVIFSPLMQMTKKTRGLADYCPMSRLDPFASKKTRGLADYCPMSRLDPFACG
jgi:hypothetical protein